ncbi:LemA domain protein [Bacillus sp. 165]|uniref:LemA domain protein n=1 Tax=Bacillus sp. 165 TaxID=1529117 RepID=UPI001AD9BE78|nr:LemA domain protein [Bacillus sp. 165]MBO9129323.1 LemA domain protein [Bacillus sp. 165]
MENQKEKLARINMLAQDIVQTLLQEAFFNKDSHLRDSVEHLANTVAALTKIQLEEDQNVTDTLRYSVSKMRIARNAVHAEYLKKEKETQELA